MEAENLKKLVPKIDQALSTFKIPYEVIVVDDGSPDKTGEVALNLGCRVVQRGRRLGLASAYLDGLKHARGRLVAFMDADLQHDPTALLGMTLILMENLDVDLVVGSRYDGGETLGWSPFRRFISVLATKFVHLMLPETRRVKDVLSGFMVFRREILDGVALKPRSWKILLEFLCKAKVNGVYEYPIVFVGRRHGESKLTLRQIAKVFLHVLALRFGR
jgi:dolichol-phosphate mannosyltransferase